jgi:hypothetical protein
MVLIVVVMFAMDLLLFVSYRWYAIPVWYALYRTVGRRVICHALID